MTIALSHPTAGPGGTPVVLDLPQDLLWPDEFAWKQVEQSLEYTSTGALHIEEWAKQAGRPITLQGGVDYAWCQRSVLLTLNTWAGQAGVVMVLTLRANSYLVVWDRSGQAISAEPVVPYSDPLPEDAYTLTLKFLEVSP